MGMVMKPQDIVVTLKILASGWPGSFAALGHCLFISASEAHAAVKRARVAGLLRSDSESVNRSAIAEFLLHAVKYLVPVRPGRRTRGMPTGFAAPVFAALFRVAPDDPNILVWPAADGNFAGLEIEPLYRTVPQAAANDNQLYEWLVIADVLRGAGGAREREFAEKFIHERLELYAAH